MTSYFKDMKSYKTQCRLLETIVNREQLCQTKNSSTVHLETFADFLTANQCCESGFTILLWRIRNLPTVDAKLENKLKKLIYVFKNLQRIYNNFKKYLCYDNLLYKTTDPQP